MYMSYIVSSIIELALMLGSCYIMTKCICTPENKRQLLSQSAARLPMVDMNQYYIIDKEEYNRLIDKQPLLLGSAAPPEYRSIADDNVVDNNVDITDDTKITVQI
jgi:hypothetical protein